MDSWSGYRIGGLPVGYVFGLFVGRLCNWNGFRRLYKEAVSHSGYIREGDSLVAIESGCFPVGYIDGRFFSRL